MKISVNDIIKEKIYCCKEIQQVIDTNTKKSLTDMKIRNLLQIVLLDEIHPEDKMKYFENFAIEYENCKTVEEIKKHLFELLK